jgi:enolase
LFFLFGIILQGELGANAILAVSIAACKAGAAEKEVYFYFYFFSLSKSNLKFYSYHIIMPQSLYF